MRNWEQIKLEEKGTTSLVEGITPGLPSLLYTNKLFRKAASIGLDPGSLDEALDSRSTPRSRTCATNQARLEADLAQLLAASVVIAARRWRRRRVGIARLGGALPRSLRRHGAARRRARRRPRRARSRGRRRPLARSRRRAVRLIHCGFPYAEWLQNRNESRRACRAGGRQPSSTAGIVPMRPALKSSTASIISCLVFITNGP